MPSSVNTVLRAWFLFSARDASVRKNMLDILKYIYIYTLNILKKKKEGESNGLSLLCKSGFGLFLS